MAGERKRNSKRVEVSDELDKRTSAWIPAEPADLARHNAIEATVLTPESEHNRDDGDEADE